MNEQDRYLSASQQFQSEKAKYSKAQKEGKDFADNLAVAKCILNNEVLFSNLITTIARTLPSGSSLQNLSLATTDFASPISLVIQTTSLDNSLKIKDAFENSSAFEQVNILTTSRLEDSKTKYSYTVTLSVTITKNAFINGKVTQ